MFVNAHFRGIREGWSWFHTELDSIRFLTSVREATRTSPATGGHLRDTKRQSIARARRGRGLCAHTRFSPLAALERSGRASVSAQDLRTPRVQPKQASAPRCDHVATS
jgi:hypothetical protein